MHFKGSKEAPEQNEVTFFAYFLQYKIWKTLEKDPLFAQPPIKLTLEEERDRTLKQIFRILEYGFLTEDDMMEDPCQVGTAD